jgi:hypothetical protein
MSIDTSGKYWTGTGPEDIDEYLRALAADGYPVDRTVHAKCMCGHDVFALLADATEGCARRECTRCNETRLICDSDEAWEDAEPEAIRCPCGGRAFQIAVGFSHRDDGTIKWITVGHRCAKCGTLASSADWKIDYSPTDHLYGQV